MLHSPSALSVIVFGLFVAVTLGLSFYFAAKTKSASGYFAAGGQIHWLVNGVAFAGDYLSAASFLGICGTIAFFGYDGFLYSIGFLAGWVVALFVVAEPLKRLGKFTFADALNSQFQSRGITLAAGISTLVVSIFYLIPQMVGAGSLIKPLLGFPHEAGVVMVGIVVVLIVATAGMVSTTYVQFIKGSLLVLFSAILTVMILNRGLKVDNSELANAPQTLVVKKDGSKFINGIPQGRNEGEADLRPVGHLSRLPDGKTETGPLGPFEYLAALQNSEVVLWSKKESVVDGEKTTTWTPQPTSGAKVLRPGNSPLFKGLQKDQLVARLDFVSLMLALFCGTASLPHILIRYYTVKNQAAARLSTVVGIGTIGAFYVLTLFLGLGAMTSGTLDLTDSNMAAPLLAKSFGETLFAVISAIAFTTVLGTVSGLIVAASGAVVHDLLSSVLQWKMNDHEKVRLGKAAAVVVGIVAIVLGILFKDMNAGFLVGWAFSVAASANLPSLVMLLFWDRTTKQGITAAIFVGLFSSLGWILLSADTFQKVYGYTADQSAALACVPFSQPGIVTIPLGFVTLILVSLLTNGRKSVVA
ncbi:sodium/solute symporter [Schlesneria paludicola]|uniref:sodium/solute symporter n=1 Tax=Schlesneria paludicola TaxID=360056 RepID=UPI00029A0875|nr:cation acetate symporter [Schlesneria paludicola]